MHNIARAMARNAAQVRWCANGGTFAPNTRMGTLPLQCPDCQSHGSVTLVTEIFAGIASHWRCMHCDHEWAAVQPTRTGMNAWSIDYAADERMEY